ncbi:MAG: hypothetical protein IPK19_15560 [Chloroflexi bacterium]|nr:hypothetical protein [Chloroflexota bacterium]
MSRIRTALQQFSWLYIDLKKINRHHPLRWLTCWFSMSALAVIEYRLMRFGYLLLGRGYPAIHALTLPLRFLLRPWFGTNCEIHYEADIGPGFRVLHPSLGVVVSAHTKAAYNLVLTGGNCIGTSGGRGEGLERNEIGGDVYLAAQANIIGPVRVGNRVVIGAGAVLVKDALDKQVVVGVPARPLIKEPRGLETIP